MSGKAVSYQPSAAGGCESTTAVRRCAFTLIELLVVIGVVALLITALVVAGGGLIDDAKNKETLGVMQILDLALEEFRQDAPLKGVPGYRDRYGDYPCDELETFRRSGTPGESATPGVDIVGPPGGASNIYPAEASGFNDIEHRDVAAMALAIRLYSAEAASVLDKIGNRYRKAPPDADQFFDRNGDTNLDIEDEPLVYYVDAWGNPFEYFAIRPDPALTAVPSDLPAENRLNTAQRLIQANHGKALFVSYGPDGADQFELLGDDFESPLVEDFSQGDPGMIDSPLNADNVYLDEELTAKLRIEAEAP